MIDTTEQECLTPIEETCRLCGHSFEDNLHGFDQNDAWMEGENCVHSGRCTYCRVCNPRIFEKEG